MRQNNFYMTVVFLLCITTVIIACQTTSKVTTKPFIPSSVESLFNTCTSKDGALNVQFYYGDELKGSADLEWISQSDGSWTTQLVDPIGQLLLELKFSSQNNSLSVKGILSEKIPEIKSSNSGFLHISNNFIGIKTAELPCFLSSTLPNSWLLDRFHYSKKGALIEFKSKDSQRNIDVTLRNFTHASKDQRCTYISWRYFLGLFKSTTSICYNMSNPTTGFINFSSYTLRWTNLDG